MKRVIAIVILVVAIVALPYWMYVPMLAGAIVYFQFFWEGVILSLLIDVLYGPGGSGLSHYPFALVALALFLATIPLRDRLRFHA